MEVSRLNLEKKTIGDKVTTGIVISIAKKKIKRPLTTSFKVIEGAMSR